MEKKIGIGIGVGLLALILAAPFALAYASGQPYRDGYELGGMMYGKSANLYLTGAGGAGPGEKDSDFDDQMVKMHNRMHGTNYTADEFEKLHERIGCH